MEQLIQIFDLTEFLKWAIIIAVVVQCSINQNKIRSLTKRLTSAETDTSVNRLQGSCNDAKISSLSMDMKLVSNVVLPCDLKVGDKVWSRRNLMLEDVYKVDKITNYPLDVDRRRIELSGRLGKLNTTRKDLLTAKERLDLIGRLSIESHAEQDKTKS